MRREQQIPLFLWVTTAIVVHLIGGEGATKVVETLEETLDIRSFASEVRQQAKTAGAPLEVSLEMDETTPEADDAKEEAELDDQLPDAEDESEPPPDAEDDQAPEKAEEQKDAEIEKPAEVEKEEPKKEEPVAEKPPEPKAPDLELPKPPQPQPAPSQRVAVDQHIKDKNQEDNPDAAFAGDEANHVEEETVAKITANDVDSNPATMGGPSGGVGEEPGNSDKEKLAQATESEGRKDRIGGDMNPAEKPPAQAGAQAASQASAAQQAQAQNKPAQAAAPAQAGQSAQEARAATQAQEQVAETVASANGTYVVPKSQEASAAQRAQKAREARAGASKQSPTGMFGLGSNGLTKNGVNLNLSYQAAQAIVGTDTIASLRKAEGEKRLSEHRGKWQTMGLERWKPALENYVASVKPGNQTALNAARVPFASYLNHIHQRLHDIYAHGFLGHLDQLPADHPLNNQEMSTHLEIALSREDGRIIKMGITKSSGVTAFDVGALESVEKAGPYGSPPGAIVSEDGNVYLHWEFHRRPEYACSTYFARPYIINGGQKSAPPRVEPPPRPTEEEKTKRDERSGAIEKQESTAAPGTRG